MIEKHDWELGVKEHKIRKAFVNKCRRCGCLEIDGVRYAHKGKNPDAVLNVSFTWYIRPEEAERFLTTNKPVEFCEYFPCGVFNAGKSG